MNLNNLERNFIYRISRCLFLFSTTIVTLSLIGSVLFFGYTISPTMKVSAPSKPVPPTAPQITAEDIIALLPKDEIEATPPPVEQVEPIETYKPPPIETNADISPEAHIEDLIEQIHTFFPEDGFPWKSKWRKKGVKDRLTWSMVYLSSKDKILFLQTILKFFDIVPPKLHFYTVESLGDISRAYRAFRPDVYDLLFDFFTGKFGLVDGEAPVPLADDQKAAMLHFIFKITKRNTPPDTFLTVIKKWKSIETVVGNENLLNIMVEMWTGLTGMEASQAAKIIADFVEILPSIQPKYHVYAIRLYYRQVQGKTRDQQRAFQRNMSNYRSALAKIEVDHNTKVLAKKGMRKMAAYGIGSAITGIAFLGLLLALLGIERNTRTLQALLRQIGPEDKKSTK